MKGWSAAIVTKQVASGVLQNHRNQQRLFRGVEQSGSKLYQTPVMTSV